MSNVLDYAIVGGGISGIYSGWRLLRDAPDGTKLSIGLFESSDRLGGRLLSVIPPGVPDARVELGGMRFISPAQKWVSSLVEYLKLPTENLPADQPQNISYIRGRMLRMFQLTNAAVLPYQLRRAESSKEDLENLTALAAMRALADVIEEVLGIKNNKWQDLSKKLTDADWEVLTEKAKIGGMHLYNLPMRYLMMRMIGLEALDLAQDSAGYDSIFHTWNAADGFPWNVGDYGPGVKYLHVKAGYQELPLRLAQQFEEDGGEIHLEARLQSLDCDGADGPVALKVVRNGSAETILARRVILAMPRRSLELLDQTGVVLDPSNLDVHELIRSVTPIPLFKLAICYSRPWWEDIPPVDPGTGLAKITSGKSTTDLPVRQCYYWKVDPKTGKAVILIYDDGQDLDYWAGLRDSSAPPHVGPDGTVDDPQLPDWSEFKAPRLMVAEVHRQLLEMHGITDPSVVPQPYAASYRDWGEDPYGGGANFWPVGVNSYRVSKRIVQPKPPYPVYVCGEAYSHAQGWVEGALQTAEDMLQNHLGLSEPEWLGVVTSG